MSSGGASRRKSWSLASRLLAWHAASAFILVVAVTAFLYWGLRRELEAGDDELLLGRIRVLSTLLRHSRENYAELRWEVELEWQGHEEPHAYLRIVDQRRKPFLETPGMSPLVPPTAFPAPAGPAEPSRGIVTAASHGRVFRVMAAEVTDADTGERWVIQAALDLASEMAVLNKYRYLMALVLGVSALTSLALGHRISRSGLRPLAEIVETTRRIRSSTLSERVRVANLPAELAGLTENFNAMLERLEQSFARVSRFSADIAHELRTPLNILRGEAEVALRKARSAEEYREVLASSLAEFAHLSRIVESLLFIALAETSDTPLQRETVDIGETLRDVADFYEPAAAEQSVTLRAESAAGLRSELDRTLFRRAVANLVSNAIAYTPPGGTVAISASRQDSAVRVQVSDTGVGIAPEHLPHVFDRFYRVERARRRSSGGAGLGLSIVRTIMDLHGGSAKIASEPGAGTVVTLLFPQVTKSEPRLRSFQRQPSPASSSDQPGCPARDKHDQNTQHEAAVTSEPIGQPRGSRRDAT